MLDSTLSRRHFLEGSGLVAGAAVLAGCGSKRASEAGSAAGSAAAAAPAGADTITYGQGAEPRSLDPAIYDDGESAKVAVQAYENLVSRTGMESVRAVSTALIQAERYGTPLGVALRTMAQESRDSRMMLAEKKAAAALG